MKREYIKLLGTEFVAVSSKWITALELLGNLAGYLWATWLWWSGAASWQVAVVGSLSLVVTFLLVYLAGQAAWNAQRKLRDDERTDANDAIQRERAQRLSAERSLKQLRDAAPRLRRAEPGAVFLEPVAFSNQARVVVWGATFLKVAFVNDPEYPGPDTDARRVNASIKILCDDQLVCLLDARWSQSSQPNPEIANFKSITHLLEMDLNPGVARSIDIAFKNVNDADAYAYNNDGYHHAPHFKKPEFRLVPGLYQARIRLRATRLDETFKVDFRNPGPGKEMEIIGVGKRIEIKRRSRQPVNS